MDQDIFFDFDSHFKKKIILIRFFYYYQWINTSAGGLLFPDGIIHQVVSVSALTWFIRYIVFSEMYCY